MDTSAAKCMPRVRDEKESECLVPNRHCSSFHSSYSVEKCYFKGFNVVLECLPFCLWIYLFVMTVIALSIL